MSQERQHFKDNNVYLFLGIVSRTIEPSTQPQSLPQRHALIRAIEEGVRSVRSPEGLRGTVPLNEEDHVQLEEMLSIFRNLHLDLPLHVAADSQQSEIH